MKLWLLLFRLDFMLKHYFLNLRLNNLLQLDLTSIDITWTESRSCNVVILSNIHNLLAPDIDDARLVGHVLSD